MSLTKTTIVDEVTVVENGAVLYREATRILEGETVISQSFNRGSVFPGQDTTGMDPKVVAICGVAHTAEVVAAYQAQQAAQDAARQGE